MYTLEIRNNGRTVRTVARSTHNGAMKSLRRALESGFYVIVTDPQGRQYRF